MAARELAPDELYRRCDADAFSFRTTDEIEPLEGILGQPRAVSAIEFGIGIEHDGYNLFVLGQPGTGRHAVTGQFLQERAATRPTPSDWCYVYNFEDPRCPRALELPAGRGQTLRQAMEALIEELRSALAAAFESEEYQTRRQLIDQETGEQQSGLFEQVQKEAEAHGLRVMQTPAGTMFVPIRDGQVMSPEEIQNLDPQRRQALEQEVERLQGELQKLMRQMPRWQRERREKIRELNRQVTRFSTGPAIDELRATYREQPEVVRYLEAVGEDVVEYARDFVGRPDAPGQGPDGQAPAGLPDGDNPFLRRYRVNVVVDHAGTEGAPVVREEHPTLANLLGRIEHLPQLGALVTDFNLIRGGALHRANGGYLIVAALDVLRQPFVWDALKRALRARELRIESMGEAMSLVQTVSLQPEPIPLSVKVVLVGEPFVYYTLFASDPQFGELFKVAAEFDDRVERDAQAEHGYARLIAKFARGEQLQPLDRGAVARAIEEAARHSADSERLSLDVARVFDMLREADHWARVAGRDTVERADIERAISERVHRSDRIRERQQQEMLRGTFDIASEGRAVGQVNGLSVLQLGDFAFGRPSRITARVRLGSGEVVDIEREVRLSGPLHSKGVLILSGFLGQRYAADRPLSLSASLVFEQSYGGVDGDSASAAELFALLSAIGRVPLKQSLAVTGSVNQHGKIQAIGGANEKIESFFDLCRDRGLSGEQGVVIPSANRPHLMLRPDVVEAVERGRFHVWTIDTVDEGIELLTGLPAGEPDEAGQYPPDTVNGRVAARLAELAAARKAFAQPPQAALGEGAAGRIQRGAEDEPEGPPPSGSGPAGRPA